MQQSLRFRAKVPFNDATWMNETRLSNQKTVWDLVYCHCGDVNYVLNNDEHVVQLLLLYSSKRHLLVR